jgi:hypothetical protein
MSGIRTSFVESLAAAARENPLAAALIGGGALWLLMGNEKLKNAANSATAAAAPLVETGTRSLRSATAKFENTASPLTAPEKDYETSRDDETLRKAKTAASDAMSEAADTINERLDQGVTYAQENLRKLGDAMPRKESLVQLQSLLSDALERQPLLLGAMGLAIGASVAGAFGTSDAENEWIGAFSDNVKADLSARAGAVSQSIREAADTVKAEFGDAGVEALDRLHQAGGDALDAVREKVRGN